MGEDVVSAGSKHGKKQTIIYFTATLLWAVAVFRQYVIA